MSEIRKNLAALGTFDSLHTGHIKLIEKTVCLAKEFNLNSAVLLLYGFKEEIFPLEERIKRIYALGVDKVFPLFFDENLKNTSGEDFLKNCLTQFNAGGFVCGFDFTYGRGGSCDARSLKEFCLKNGLEYYCLKQVEYGGKKISTTEVKKLLSLGNIEEANRLLSQPYYVTGRVEKGNKIGRTLGFPTANIKVSYGKNILKTGVYGGSVCVGDKKYKAIINYGGKPTVEENYFGIEAYLYAFDGDLYGEEVKAEFEAYLRDIKKFPDITSLKRQLEKDKEYLL